MTPQEAFACLSHLVVATGSRDNWDDETVEEYVAQLVSLDDAEALYRACASIVRAWTDKRRPPVATIIESYDRERTLGPPRNAIDPIRVHCDGTGWRFIATDDDSPADSTNYVPCARCNPMHARIYADADKFAHWAQGTPPEMLGIGVERVNGRLRFTDGTVTPLPCRPAHDPDERTLTPDEGRKVAALHSKAV